jgi:hypothetical protein
MQERLGALIVLSLVAKRPTIYGGVGAAPVTSAARVIVIVPFIRLGALVIGVCAEAYLGGLGSLIPPANIRTRRMRSALSFLNSA